MVAYPITMLDGDNSIVGAQADTSVHRRIRSSSKQLANQILLAEDITDGCCPAAEQMSIISDTFNDAPNSVNRLGLHFRESREREALQQHWCVEGPISMEVCPKCGYLTHSLVE